MGQLRLNRLWKEEGGEGAPPLQSSASPFTGRSRGRGTLEITALGSRRIPHPLRANCREGGGKRARRERGQGRTREAAREGARARAAADSPSGSSPDLTSSRPPLRPVTRETQDAWASPGCWKMKLKVAQSFPTLCNQARILRARILEWVAFPFSRGFSQPRDGTQLSRFAGGFFTS